MSYDYREAGADYGDQEEQPNSRKGSVKAARERLHASQRAQMQGIIATNQARLGLPARPNQLVSQFSMPQDVPTPPSSNGSMNATPRNAPSPQWPLRNVEEEDDYFTSIPAQRGRPQQPQQPQQPERNAPGRPSRPERGPPQFNSQQTGGLLPIQNNNYPAARAALRSPKESWQDEDGYLSPSFGEPSPRTNRPITTSSQASTTSSLGSIPDFPVPSQQQLQQQQMRRSANIGPPPSARRGPSSYYSSHMSYVSPIVEESEGTRSHNSYASSNVMPIDRAGFYFDEDISPSDEEVPIRSNQSSRAEDHDDQSNLVRKASLGRRTKPSLTTIKSGDSLKRDGNAEQRQAVPNLPSQMAQKLGGGTVLLDASSSSDESTGVVRKGRTTASGEHDTKADSMTLPIVFGADVLPVSPTTKSSSPPMTLAQRVGNRRPPRLNVDAVREAEARGSLTSLPDLIRRATKLAANLDRGKTASRLGLDFYENGAFDKEKGDFDNRRSGSLSDMLASFPPPGVATPQNDNSPRVMSQWPSARNLGQSPSQLALDQKAAEQRRRRCCGMPFWGFITLMIILFLLVAAAVIIPIVLIVLPRQNNATAASSAAPKPVSCTNSLTCDNGGVLIAASDGSCQCLCTNGFTGAKCATAGGAGCVTTQVSDIQNATLGSSIPRLLNSSSNFNIPLDASQLLSEFSSSDLSCAAENALVTFNGLSARWLEELNMPLLDFKPSVTASGFAPLITPPPLAARAPVVDDGASSDLPAFTSNGIVIQATQTTANGNAAAPTGSSSSSSSLMNNATILDFSRVSVLYVLQVARELDTAVTAQERLQTFLEGTATIKGSDAQNLTLGNGFFIDLRDFRLSLSNGSVVGLTPGTSYTT